MSFTPLRKFVGLVFKSLDDFQDLLTHGVPVNLASDFFIVATVLLGSQKIQHLPNHQQGEDTPGPNLKKNIGIHRRIPLNPDAVAVRCTYFLTASARRVILLQAVALGAYEPVAFLGWHSCHRLTRSGSDYSQRFTPPAMYRQLIASAPPVSCTTTWGLRVSRSVMAESTWKY